MTRCNFIHTPASCCIAASFLCTQVGKDSYLFRDTKPENVTFDTTTEQVKLIDYGLAMRCDTWDYHCGFTVGRFTPDIVDPADDFKSFYTAFGRSFDPNPTTDVFLTGQQGLEMICGLSLQLQPPAGPCVLLNMEATDAMLWAHHNADYPTLISQVESRKARDFLLQAMAVEYKQRLTPPAALRHRFLAGRAAEVEARVLETSPAHAQRICHILDLLAPLEPGVFWQQITTNSGYNSGYSAVPLQHQMQQ